MHKRLGVFILLLPFTAHARFAHLGARAIGMGGAHVAVVDDSSAVYWNPAALAFIKPSFAMNVDTAGYVETYGNFLEKIDHITSYEMDYITQTLPQKDTLDTQDVALIVSLTKDIYDLVTSTIFLRAGAWGSLPIAVKNFGTGTFAFYEGGGWLLPDFERVGSASPDAMTAIERLADAPPEPSEHFFSPDVRSDLIGRIETLGGDWSEVNPQTGRTYATDYVYRVEEGLINNGLTPGTNEKHFAEAAYKVASATKKIEEFGGGGNTLDLNESKVVFKTLFVTEIPLSYAYRIKEHLSIGGSFKIMYGLGYETELYLRDENTNWDKIIDEVFSFGNGRTNVGIDLSFLYRSKIINAGLLLKNINFPAFKTNRGNTIRVYPTIRAGVGVSPVPFFTFAMDLDLYPSPTFYSEVKEMELSIGTEFNVAKILYLRGGYTHNLMFADELGEFGIGLGINIIKVKLDIGVTLSNFVEISDIPVPTDASGEISLVMKF